MTARRTAGPRPPLLPALPPLLAITFLMLPPVGILARTRGSELGEHLTTPGSLEALRLSLVVSFWTLGLSLVLGALRGRWTSGHAVRDTAHATPGEDPVARAPEPEPVAGSAGPRRTAARRRRRDASAAAPARRGLGAAGRRGAGPGAGRARPDRHGGTGKRGPCMPIAVFGT
ncbi:hypothetical protein ACFWNR_35475 [Streptomyces virginiae]|uniref:hypothetical protein n=1 Tax=Streptomyces virginiae TaxID=1961 RepID=UPI00366393FC